jgi:nucleotide-binding universal stress UspA family protein
VSETVVVGYDGGESAGRALDEGIERAKAAQGAVVLVTVQYGPVDAYEPATLDPVPLESGEWADEPEWEVEPPPALKPLVEEAARRAEAAGVAHSSVWGVGDPAQVIVDAARDHGASTIVIGKDHHGFFGRLFGDDVEGEVKREASADVVVVS